MPKPGVPDFDNKTKQDVRKVNLFYCNRLEDSRLSFSVNGYPWCFEGFFFLFLFLIIVAKIGAALTIRPQPPRGWNDTYGSPLPALGSCDAPLLNQRLCSLLPSGVY